jgi:hypothetical protein
MSDHYCCKKCGLRECVCFVEDIPDSPFYHGKFCIRGANYKITPGIEMDKMTIYEKFAEKWYDTYEQAVEARNKMLLIEKARMEARLAYLNKEISS